MRKLIVFFIFIAIVVFLLKRFVPSGEQMLANKQQEQAVQLRIRDTALELAHVLDQLVRARDVALRALVHALGRERE